MLVTSQVIELSVLVRWLDIIAPGRSGESQRGLVWVWYVAVGATGGGQKAVAMVTCLP